ncbi:MAG: hypothetical protein ACKVQV_03105 [Bacteroidia bacterium]
MKLLIGFAFFLCLNCPTRVLAQTNFPHTLDLIVEIKKFNQEKHLSLIAQSLEEYLSNSMIKNVCNWSGWILIRIDEDQISPQILLDILKNAGLEVEWKEGATLSDLTIACKEPVYQF